MALSQKTLQVDTILVETLYHRGVPLSTTVGYMATLSTVGPYISSVHTSIQDNPRDCTPVTKPSLGQFLQWVDIPVSTLYYPLFYDVNNTQDLADSIEGITTQNQACSTLIQPMVDTITTLSTVTIQTYSNLFLMNASTISSYYSTMNYNSTYAVNTYNTIKSLQGNISTSILNVSSSLYSNFSTNSSILTQLAIHLYALRPVPLPRDPNGQVPWYWNGPPTNNIQAGLSSMFLSTVLNQGLINSYLNTLSSTSTLWGLSNSTIQGKRLDYISYTNTASNYTDTCSSIAISFSTYTSTINSTLETVALYGEYLSSFSTSFGTYTDNYSIPTDGPDISTGSSSIIGTYSTFNTILLEYLSSGILQDPLNTFSFLEGTAIRSVNYTIYTSQNYDSLSSLYLAFSTIILPTANVISPSTNVAGYKTVSSYGMSMFSTFSSMFYTLLGQTMISTTSSLKNSIFTFSTIMNQETSTVYGTNLEYMAAPGLSTLNSNLSTYRIASYQDYSSQVSSLSTFLQFSTVIYRSTLNSIASYYSRITRISNYSSISTTQFLSIQASTLNTCSITIGAWVGIQKVPTGLATVAVQGGIAIQPSVGSNPSLSFSNIDIYATDSNIVRVPSRNSILLQLSSIIVNTAFAIVSNSSTLVGINTLTPAYALDLVGDARKTIGSTWITPSDQRVKDRISDTDYATVVDKISSLRLVSYRWSEDYRAKYDLSRNDYLGFISQEVETIFPKAVTQRNENGFVDFRSLNTDQLMKAKFAVTRQLIQRMDAIQLRINNLLEY